jgi:hypothetical protein
MKEVVIAISPYVSEVMAGTTGLEPATSAVTGQRSNQLSYVPQVVLQQLEYRSHRMSGIVYLPRIALCSTLPPHLNLRGL